VRGQGPLPGGRPARALALLSAGSALGLAACAEPPPGVLARCAAPRPAAVAAAPAEPPAEAPPGRAAAGAALFARECARCHSPRLADRGSRFFRDHPRLDCAPWREAVSAGYLWRVIAAGGEAVGLDEAMKGFADELSPQERADLVAHLRAGPPAP